MNPARQDKQGQALLRRLSFVDNFECLEIELEIPAATELAVTNPFRDGSVPGTFLIANQESGGPIVRGTTAWTADLLYFTNLAMSSDAVVRILVFR